MFGFSFSKLALLAAIIVGVLLIFRLLKGRNPPKSDEIEVADTVRCRVCGAYVPKSGIGRCEREDCPY